MSDNFHQAVMGGTGSGFIFLGTADMAFYSDGNGNSLAPPKELIEDSNPWPGSINWYARDGYQSGSYVNCADRSQPGVAAIARYLQSQHRSSNCATGLLLGQQLDRCTTRMALESMLSCIRRSRRLRLSRILGKH